MRWFIIFLLITTSANACNWKDDIPCLTINANSLDYKIKPTSIISQKEIKTFNLNTLTKVLNFVNGSNAVQSGPIGQHSSLFLRGTNSNHTLVLLNGIPINDFSTPTGAFDFGQDFMYNVSFIQVYKGASASKFGIDAIGGAINIITITDYETKISTTNKSINGNYYTNINDWDINIQGGHFKEKESSALKHGSDKDSVNNKSIGINLSKWYDNINFKTTFFSRNTFTNIDGHSLDIQNGFSDNTFFALQTGVEQQLKNGNNYLYLHTHEYDRKYESDEYKSENYFIKLGHQNNIYGFGLDYKYDQSHTQDDDNVSLFTNYTNGLISLGARKDSDFNSYNIGLFKNFNDLNVRANHSTGYKKRTTWTLEEDSKTNELIFDYNNITLALFESDTGIQNQDGIELSYNINNFEIFASKLNSKKNEVVQLRRPKFSGGFNYIYDFNDFNLITSYNYIGESKDIHNSNWSIIDMKELHLFNLGIEKNGFTLNINNLLNENYEMPHGFTGKERQVTIGFTKKY